MTREEEQEFERLRAENAALRRVLAVSQAQVGELNQQLATALERIVELEAQVQQRRDPPAFVKAKRPRAKAAA